MKTQSTIRKFFLAGSIAALLAAPSAQAATYTWDPSNVTGTPTATLDWFTGGANSLGLWTGVVVPVSASDTTIRFFADTTTSLPNTVPSTQTANLNNGGSAFELGALTLNGFGSATSGASLTMTLQGDALNFSAATGTISFNSVKNVAPAADPVINYTINNNIQLGTASSVSALTLTGNGDNAGSTTYNIGGTISELQTGGGSILKSGSSIVTISGPLSITGAVTVSAGQLNLTNSTNTASSFTVSGGTLNVTSSAIAATTMTVNGGTLILTGNHNPASGSMTVNTGGALRIGNNTATQFGPAGVYSGNISTGTGGTLQLWSTSAQELSGIISGSGGIHKSYGGALTLSNSNTYTGKTQIIPQTTAAVTQNVSFFNSVFTNAGLGTVHSTSGQLGAPITVANGTIDLNGQAQASVTLNYVAAATGETTDRVLNLGWNSSSTITLTAANTTGVLRFTSAFTSTANSGHSGSLTLRGAGQGQIDQGLPQLGTAGLIKNDAGTWTLGGSGNFTGATTITAGTLRLSSATALQNSPFSTASVAGGAAAGLRIDTTTLTLGGLTGANALRGRFTTALGGPASATAQGGYDGLTNLTLNTVGGSNFAYTGAIVEGATGMSLTKTGAGIQTLNATHTYTGTTSVNGGFLQLNGNTLTGGLSVSNATFASNSSFAGLSSVTSGGVITPGASLGAIGTLTIDNASASALTLNGSTSIFDLPSTVTTPDRIAVTGGGGLVLNGTNTVLLQTSTTGTPAGTYDLMTFTGTPTGAGSLVFSNGSTTKGNATLNVSAGLVQLTVAAGGLAGTSTFTGAGGTGATDLWNTAARWNSGVVPTGTTNVVLAPTGTQTVVVNAVTPTAFSGDLTLNPGVAVQVGWTTSIPTVVNALGTPGTSIIFMGAGSQIRVRNAGSGTFSDIVLLGNANVSLGESTQTGMAATFGSITGPYAFSLYTHGIGGAAGSANFTAANSFTTLNLTGTGALTVNAANSIGTATVNMGDGTNASTIILNIDGALTDGANPIRFNPGILSLSNGVNVTAALSLPTRPIELNGAGGATINNANTTAARTITLGGGISSTAAGAKTVTLGGANTGDNTISGAITDGTAGSIALTKADAGKWVLSNNNSYTGTTTVSAGTLTLTNSNTTTGATNLTAGTLALTHANAIQNSALTVSGGTLSLLHDTNNTTFADTSTTFSNTATITVNNNGSGTGNTLKLGAVSVSATTSATFTVTNGNSYILGHGAVTQTLATGTTLSFANAAPMNMASYATNSTTGTARETLNKAS